MEEAVTEQGPEGSGFFINSDFQPPWLEQLPFSARPSAEPFCHGAADDELKLL